MKEETRKSGAVAIVAIAGIVIIECLLLALGYNGKVALLMAAIIAGLGGWVLPQPEKIAKLMKWLKS